MRLADHSSQRPGDKLNPCADLERSMNRTVRLFPDSIETCRLGLATRGDTGLVPADCFDALDRGINFWNWCGYEDGMSRAMTELGRRRNEVFLAVQIQSTHRDGLLREIENYLRLLGADRIDLATIYYLETEAEWREHRSPAGVIEGLQGLKAQGVVRRVGITSHQRKLAAGIAQRGETELLMIRYNAAHRGAEEEIFPITDAAGIPVIAYTCLRWGELLKPQGPPPHRMWPPSALDCYRFVLGNPSVAVALTAPNGRAELEENLSLLEDWRPPTEAEDQRMREWGDLVHRFAGAFP